MARQYSRAHLIAHARAEAEAKGIDPHLFLMQISRESSFKQNEDGPVIEHPDGTTQQSLGIAMLTPEWHPARGVELDFWAEGRDLDPYDPLEALEYAALLMQSRIRTHLGKDSWTYDPNRAYTKKERDAVREALADYNAGPDPDSIYREGGRTQYADLIMADADKIRRIDSVSKAQLDYWHKHGIRPTEQVGPSRPPDPVEGDQFKKDAYAPITLPTDDPNHPNHIPSTRVGAPEPPPGTQEEPATRVPVQLPYGTHPDPRSGDFVRDIKQRLSQLDQLRAQFDKPGDPPRRPDLEQFRGAVDHFYAGFQALLGRAQRGEIDGDGVDIPPLQELYSGLYAEMTNTLGPMLAVQTPEGAKASFNARFRSLLQANLFPQGISEDRREEIRRNPGLVVQAAIQAAGEAAQAVRHGDEGTAGLSIEEIIDIKGVLNVAGTHVANGLDTAQTEQILTALGYSGKDAQSYINEARGVAEGLAARIRDKDDPLTGDEANTMMRYVVDTIRGLTDDPNPVTAALNNQEKELLQSFVGMTVDQARNHAADILANRRDLRQREDEEEERVLTLNRELHAQEESRSRYGREEQIGIRTDIRELQQRQQEQQTGVSRAMAAAQQQLASEYLGHAPQFGPVTPGAKIGGANIYEHLGRTLEERSRGAYPIYTESGEYRYPTQEEAMAALPVGTLDPGYLPYGGPVPRVPQASDMQAWQEALASARADVAYQNEAEMMAGLPQYRPVGGISAPVRAAG